MAFFGSSAGSIRSASNMRVSPCFTDNASCGSKQFAFQRLLVIGGRTGAVMSGPLRASSAASNFCGSVTESASSTVSANLAGCAVARTMVRRVVTRLLHGSAPPPRTRPRCAGRRRNRRFRKPRGAASSSPRRKPTYPKCHPGRPFAATRRHLRGREAARNCSARPRPSRSTSVETVFRNPPWSYTASR